MTGKKLGLALGSGAARGWAHLGVLQGLEELGLVPDAIAGCSVGALVGGAYIRNALEPLEAWARELSPISALSNFSLSLGPGGLVDSAAAFEAFREFDADIETLPIKFATVATDLGTGDEVWLTEGSLIDAIRASSAIPVLLHAVQSGDRWLVDGAVSNPTPVSLARHLGADVIVAVDLNAVPNVLDRFKPPSVDELTANLPATIPAPDPGLTGAVRNFVEETRRKLQEQIALVKARQDAKPQLIETAYAAVDIFQMHLSRARMLADKPDIVLRPDMRDALPTAFDRADDFIAEGRRALLAEADALMAALKP